LHAKESKETRRLFKLPYVTSYFQLVLNLQFFGSNIISTSIMDRHDFPAGTRPNFWPGFYWSSVFLGYAFISLAIMWYRWGGTVEDSLAYFNTARYLRGELPVSELRAPFPYRLAMPALAAYLPGDLRNGFAALNWLATAGTAVALACLVKVSGGGRQRALIAGLLLIISVPTFWYAPYLLTDPGAIFGRTIFALGVVATSPWLALGGALFATAAREENILLLGWLLIFGRVGVLRGGIVFAIAVIWLIVVRWWAFPGLPSYVWTPNIGTIISALRDQRSLLSLFSAGILIMPLAFFGWKFVPEKIKPLKGILIMMAMPPLYAALSVRVEGRAIWSLYPFLIPIAVHARLPGFLASSARQ
jgi:hypothetical protein